ncbi:MAG: hypothetical protein ACLP1D_29495 [Xanthobacteraceae bacterium]
MEPELPRETIKRGESAVANSGEDFLNRDGLCFVTASDDGPARGAPSSLRTQHCSVVVIPDGSRKRADPESRSLSF